MIVFRGNIEGVTVKVLILWSTPDDQEARRFVHVLRRAGVSAGAFRIREGWEEESSDGILHLLATGTHVLLETRKDTLSQGWFYLSAGFALARGDRLALYRPNPALRLPTYLADATVLASAAQAKAYYVQERDRWTREHNLAVAHDAIEAAGLGFSEEAFAGCVAEGNVELVKRYLEVGFSPNTRTRVGVPVLSVAVRGRHREVVALLIEHGADIDAVSGDRGNTAIMDAAAEGDVAVVRNLIHAGADLDVRSKNNQTALILAVGRGLVDVAEALIEGGADVTPTDSLGMSACKYAELFQSARILKLLERVPEAYGSEQDS
jgi:uncharacterized protein